MRTANRWEGVWPVVATPFGSDGEIDFNSLAREAEFLCGQGVAGLVVGGVTSEAYMLTTDERRRIAEFVADRLPDSLGLVVGCWESTGDLRAEAVRHAEGIGASAVMLSPSAGPVMDCGSPLILQDQAFVGSGPVEIEDLAAIAADAQAVRAVKVESPPSAQRMRRVAALAPSVALIAGQGGRQLPSEFAAGARAVFPGPGFPAAYTAVLAELHAAGRSETHRRILPLLNFLFQSAEFAIAGYKTILHNRGVIARAATRMRVALDDEDREELRRLFEEAGL